MGVSLAHGYGVVNTYQFCLGGVCLINTGIPHVLLDLWVARNGSSQNE